MERGGTWSVQFGGDRVDVAVDGWNGFVLYPSGSDRGAGSPMPWVWYAPTFITGEYPLPKQLHAWYVERLLAKGFCIAGVDIGESWGNQKGREGFTAFYRACVGRYGLSHKACLWPQSRGGLMHYNWAVEHPECVACIGGIYSLVNLGGLRLGDVRFHEAYGMDADTFRTQVVRHNPIDRLESLAGAKVPVFNVHGDNDAIVPLEENVGELTRRYRALGGPAELLVIPGEGHEEIPVFFTCQALLDFFAANSVPSR